MLRLFCQEAMDSAPQPYASVSGIVARTVGLVDEAEAEEPFPCS